MSIPAVIYCSPDSYKLRVAGLLIIDRLMVALYRAGIVNIIAVAKEPLPRLQRTSALGISVQSVTESPQLSGPILILTSHLLVQPSDLKILLEQGGRLLALDGTPLPVGMVREFSTQSVEEQLAMLPGKVAQGVAAPVSDTVSATKAARALWASLTSSADGLVDKYFNRPVGRYLSKILVHTAVSPNQVSVCATILGLISAWFFALGDYKTALLGAIILQVSAIVDCVDGDLARALFKESRLGRWLDIAGDQVVHIAVFICIGLGLYRTGSEAPVLWLAASAGIGVLISFAVVVHSQLQPESRRNTRLQKLIDATTNRDFSVLLIMLAALGKLSWFLWMTAIGVHVFWIIALGVQMINQPAAATLNSNRENRA